MYFSDRRAFALSLLFVLSAMLAAHIYFGGAFITSDAFERARSASQLFLHGYPVESTAVGAQSASSYPPVFDAFFASLKLLTGTTDSGCFLLASLVFSALLFSLAFAFCRAALAPRSDDFCGLLCCLAAAVSLFLSPWIFYRGLNPISETLGLSLCFLAVYAFWKLQNPALVFFLLTVLSFSHFRSFSVACACLAILAVMHRRKREFLFESFAGVLLFLYFVPRSALGFANPFVQVPGLFDFFSPVLLAGALVGAVALVAFGRKIPSVLLALVAGPLALSIFAPFAFRQFPYLALPAAILLCAGFCRFASAFGKRACVAAFAVLLVACAFSFDSFIVARSPPVSLQSAQVMSVLAAFPQESVAAGFAESYALPYYSQKKVLLGSFAEELPDYSSRVFVSQSILNGSLDYASRYMFNLYGVELVLSGYSNSSAAFEGLASERLLSSDAYSAYFASAAVSG